MSPIFWLLTVISVVSSTGQISPEKCFPMLAPFSLNPLYRLQRCIWGYRWALDLLKKSAFVPLAMFECLNLIFGFSPDKTWHSQTPKTFPGTLFKLPLSGIPFLSEIQQQFKLPNIWNFQKYLNSRAGFSEGQILQKKICETNVLYPWSFPTLFFKRQEKLHKLVILPKLCGRLVLILQQFILHHYLRRQQIAWS